MASYTNFSSSCSERSGSPSPSCDSSFTTISQRPSISSISSRCTAQNLTALTFTPADDAEAINTASKVTSLYEIGSYQSCPFPPTNHCRLINIPDISNYGIQVLREPSLNKGTSFSPSDRISKKLDGLIPHVFETMETQCLRALKMINSRSSNVEKYLYLSILKANNTNLFYRLIIDNIGLLMPIVYTPTIGDICLQYSTLYTHPEALYISIKQRKSISKILRNWPFPDPSICVVTDGSRVLGLGDLGVNGVGISIGKLALYTAAAGIHPEKTLPIVIDCGTSNQKNLQDPLYIGLRQSRVSSQDALDFMDEFMAATREVFPNMFVQFEDFESEKAFQYLERYRMGKCFNDDIQGTGAVVLAGYINSVKISGVPLEDQKLVFVGAGSAGVGVAKQILEYYTRRGLSEYEAKQKFYLVDSKGMVTRDRGDQLSEHKKIFARSDNNGQQFRTIEEIINYVKPTALIGLTATFGTFTEPVVRALNSSVKADGSDRRPILFPLSNPLTKAECTFEQAMEWTDGDAIFASGSPFTPYTSQKHGRNITYYPNQGNNVYIFPGLGLGAILSKARRITDDMVYTSAEALAGCLNHEEVQMNMIYPKIERVRDASVIVAREVMKCCRNEGISSLPEKTWLEWEEWGDVALMKWIRQQIYNPKW